MRDIIRKLFAEAFVELENKLTATVDYYLVERDKKSEIIRTFTTEREAKRLSSLPLDFQLDTVDKTHETRMKAAVTEGERAVFDLIFKEALIDAYDIRVDLMATVEHMDIISPEVKFVMTDQVDEMVAVFGQIDEELKGELIEILDSLNREKPQKAFRKKKAAIFDYAKRIKTAETFLPYSSDDLKQYLSVREHGYMRISLLPGSFKPHDPRYVSGERSIDRFAHKIGRTLELKCSEVKRCEVLFDDFIFNMTNNNMITGLKLRIVTIMESCGDKGRHKELMKLFREYNV